MEKTFYLDFLKAKNAIFKLIIQNLVPIKYKENDDRLYLYDYCESAYERAFSALGIEEDLISIEDFCKLYYTNTYAIDQYNGHNDERAAAFAEDAYSDLEDSYKRYQDKFKSDRI